MLQGIKKVWRNFDLYPQPSVMKRSGGGSSRGVLLGDGSCWSSGSPHVYERQSSTIPSFMSKVSNEPIISSPGLDRMRNSWMLLSLGSGSYVLAPTCSVILNLTAQSSVSEPTFVICSCSCSS